MSETTKTVTVGSYADVLTVGLAYEPDNTDELSDDITVSTDVLFSMRLRGSPKSIAPKIDDEDAVILSSTGGIVVVQYAWQVVNNDLDTKGTYRGELVFMINGLKLYTPSPIKITIIIIDNED